MLLAKLLLRLQSRDAPLLNFARFYLLFFFSLYFFSIFYPRFEGMRPPGAGSEGVSRPDLQRSFYYYERDKIESALTINLWLFAPPAP